MAHLNLQMTSSGEAWQQRDGLQKRAALAGSGGNIVAYTGYRSPKWPNTTRTQSSCNQLIDPKSHAFLLKVSCQQCLHQRARFFLPFLFLRFPHLLISTAQHKSQKRGVHHEHPSAIPTHIDRSTFHAHVSFHMIAVFKCRRCRRRGGPLQSSIQGHEDLQPCPTFHAHVFLFTQFSSISKLAMPPF